MRADVAVIGAGPGGLAAAVAAKENGAENVIIIDREPHAGGILGQCIHSGFGLHVFGEELTGPEYAARFIDKAKALSIPVLTGTMVLDVSRQKKITAVSLQSGLFVIDAKAVVLAMGCRERSAGALMIPGTRPAGVMTAGTAQRFVNIEGYMPGKQVVILGSGDIGLIMARRMTLEGAQVKMVLEIMPYSGGLKRNIVQCLDDFGIPLLLSHTVTRLHGKKRLEGVSIAKVDGKPIPGSERFVPCDTLLLSVGLIPENEISRQTGVIMDDATGGPLVDSNMQTSIPGIFACGNALHVHDLADNVTQEAQVAGRSAARYIRQGLEVTGFATHAGDGVRYLVPQRLCADELDKKLFFRVDGVYRDCFVTASVGGNTVYRKKRRVLTPGEMENIIISQKDLNGDITVSVEGA